MFRKIKSRVMRLLGYRQTTMSAVVTRADGTVEDLGQISSGWTKNWRAASASAANDPKE